MKFPELGYGKPLNMKWIRKVCTSAVLVLFFVHYVYLIMLNNSLTDAFYARALLIAKRSQLASKYPIVFTKEQLVILAKAEEVLGIPTSASETCHSVEKTVSPMLLSWVYECENGSNMTALLNTKSGELSVKKVRASGDLVENTLYLLRNDAHIDIVLYEESVESRQFVATTSDGFLFSDALHVSFVYNVKDMTSTNYVCRHELGLQKFSDYRYDSFDTIGSATRRVYLKDRPVVMTVLCEKAGGGLFGETVFVYPKGGVLR